MGYELGCHPASSYELLYVAMNKSPLSLWTVFYLFGQKPDESLIRVSMHFLRLPTFSIHLLDHHNMNTILFLSAFVAE